ncbi:hypothetical protein P3L10_015528 [Capsicum annuum]
MLEKQQNRRVVFVGDSIGRNHRTLLSACFLLQFLILQFLIKARYMKLMEVLLQSPDA